MHQHHILLIDDHELVRAGLRVVLANSLPELEVDEVSSILEATQSIAVAPALVLLDIELPGLNGIDGIAVLRKKWPGCPVIVVSSHSEAERIDRALARGALAYLSKAESSEKLVAHVRRVLDGHGADPVPASGAAPDGAVHLTARQGEVLDLLCQGLSNKLIAHRLALSEFTVRGHVQAIFAQLGVTSRSEAVFVAHQRKLVH